MNKRLLIGLGIAFLAFIFGLGFNFFSNRVNNEEKDNSYVIEDIIFNFVFLY